MTFLIDRPAFVDRPARLEALCLPHAHTARCWWHIGRAAWDCPPSGSGPT
jgi:hypothetical protein